MFQVTRFTLQLFVRGSMLPVFAVLLTLFTLLAGWNQIQRQNSRWQAYQQATQTVRADWENQGAQNPHSSAHYGHYAFLPVSPWQSIDPGVVRFTGTMLRLEGHMQHEPVFSAASEEGVMSRFPEVSLAWMIQTLLPLLVILLGFGIVASEREQQTWKWQVLQGVTPKKLLFGKGLALSIVVQGMLAWMVGIQALMDGLLAADSGGGSVGWQFMFWWLSQAIYVQWFVFLILLISSWAKSARQALMVGLSTWLLLVVLLPRVAADWSAKQHPLPTRVMFNRQLAEDRKKGINGHDPQDERARRFEDSLLKVYKVDSLSQLPVNADGLIMQADEVYSNQVYDLHFSRVRQTLLQQISWARWFGVVSPTISAQQLSMGLAGTDVHAYLHFTRTAEDYRRYLIEALNHKMAYGGSKTGDWDWTVDASYFKDLRDYSYTPLTLNGIWRAYQRDVFLLVGWLLILFAALVWSGKRMPLI